MHAKNCMWQLGFTHHWTLSKLTEMSHKNKQHIFSYM